MKNNNPKISVLIPLYNYGQYLCEAVESVEQQTYSNWEIIVVDDCSTDDSFKIAEGLKRKLSGRLKLIRNSTNQGVSRSRNIAFEAAQGEYIAFLDADDRWHPAKLEMQMKLFEIIDKPTHMVHTGVEAFADADTVEWLKNNGGRIKSLDNWDSAWNNLFLEKLRWYSGSYFDILCWSDPICLSSVVITRQALFVLGGFDEGLLYQIEDWLLWLKCSLLFQIRFLPDRLTYYRVHRQAYTTRVLIQDGFNSNVARGQLYDRCVAFARKKGLRLSYEHLQPKFPLKLVVSRGKRFLIKLMRHGL